MQHDMVLQCTECQGREICTRSISRTSNLCQECTDKNGNVNVNDGNHNPILINDESTVGELTFKIQIVVPS